MINGYPYWLHENQRHSLWFNKIATNWTIGSKDNLGIAKVGIAGPKGKDSYPQELTQGWRYSNNGLADAGPNNVNFYQHRCNR